MSGILGNTNFMFTNAARIISATNGSLSAASSMLIISMILRSSPEARANAYHMIIFFMSFWDIISSIAVAVNTIPMPTDVHEIYPFVGETYGNVGTCEAQGFLLWMAALFVLGSNTTLNLYYVCALRYGMAEEKFKRCLLPVMLVLSMTISVTMPTVALRTDSYNPSPYRNFCAFAQYPYGCNLDTDKSDSDGFGEENGAECIRGGNTTNLVQVLEILWSILISGTFLVLVFSLMLVVVTVFDAELAIRRSRRIQRSTEAGERSRATLQEIEFKRTRAVLIQALMYIGAFLLSWIWSIILIATISTHSPERGPNNTVAFLTVFFQPLQGFFNAMIFVYQKLHTLRQTNVRLNFFQAIKQVILSPSTVPQELISSIGVIEEDVGLRHQGDRQVSPRQLTSSQRQQIALNSGMRRFGAEDDRSTPPPSMSSGVSSTSLDQFSTGISMRDIISIDENESIRSASFISQNTDATPSSSIVAGAGLSSIDP